MEKCTWHCEHSKCTKLCSEPCDRELCKVPSKSTIKKCNHSSIGVCGEKTPRLCRICDKDEVEEIFFGEEDEKDACFIELEDCGHIIEVNGLIRWINSDDSNSDPNNRNSIQFKNCPKCKTVIRSTKSLNTFIQASLRDIQQVKLKTRGHPKVNKKNQSKLFEKVKNILANESFGIDPLRLKYIYINILNETKFQRFPRPNQKLIELENKLDLVENMKMIWLAFDRRDKTKQNLSTEVIETFDERLQMAASFIKHYINCDQQRADISAEISFVELMCDVIVKASHQPFNDTGKKLLNDAFTLANKYGSAIEDVRNGFKKIVNEACIHSSGLGISMAEKEMVLKAMDLTQGHWFKCPNGHIYAIGDCGGAMEKSKCPECKETIGGVSHRLERSNALATEMDGATVGAWPGGMY